MPFYNTIMIYTLHYKLRNRIEFITFRASSVWCIWKGRKISTQDGSDKDVDRRIGLARGTWQALGKVWNSKDLNKICVYEALVLSTLVYNAETRILKEKQKQRLRVFELAGPQMIEEIR